MNDHWLEFGMVNAYFDFNDISDPIKTYYEDVNFYSMVPYYPNYLTIKVAHNEYQTDDNLVFQGLTAQGSFYNVRSKDIQPDNYNNREPGKIMTILVYLTPEYQLYERYSFSIFDMFGLIGGLYEICKILGGLIVGGFVERLFELSVLSNLYQVSSPASETTKITPVNEESLHDKDLAISTQKDLKIDLDADEDSKNENATKTLDKVKDELENNETNNKMKLPEI
jgi:hypothetical protein